jgi:ABC-type phosphate transport system substrate-binding protein
MRFKPSTALRSRKLRSALAAGVVIGAVGGIAVAQSAPAKADPTETLVVVGSDTIQDVWNAFATTFGGNLVGSYNATNPVTGAINENITPADGSAGVNCSFARPNGSGQGVAALRLANNAASTHASKAIAPFPALGCVDIARSSGGPDVVDTNAAVDLQYIPFALDAVTGATGPSSCAATPDNCAPFIADAGNGSTVTVSPVPTVITHSNDFSQTDVHNLYNCNQVTVDGVTYWPYGGVGSVQPAGTQRIDLYQPQAGSGTRSFWEGAAGVNYPDNSACVFATVQFGALSTVNTGGTGAVVEEHDGSTVATDQYGYGPFSIAQYISQSVNNHNPRWHDAQLMNISGISPFVTAGTPSSGLNTAFPITRNVYDVVRLARVTNSADPLSTLLSGTGSSVCSQKSTIKAYGFALLGSSCGSIITPNQVAP